MDGEPANPGITTADTSTIPAEPPESWTRMERSIHVAAFTLVGGIVVLAAIGLLGVRTGTVAATGGGYSIEVLRAQITRPGLATPFGVGISTVDGSGLPSTVTLRLSSPYLSIFDFNGLQPTPSATFSTEEWTWWSFDMPAGQRRLRIDLDARLEPAVQWGRSGSVALEIDDATPVSVDFTTWVMP